MNLRNEGNLETGATFRKGKIRFNATYRIRRGYHQIPFAILGDPSGPWRVREGVGAEEAEAARTP